MPERFPRIARFRSPAALRQRFQELGIDLPCDDVVETSADSPLGRPLDLGEMAGSSRLARNRFVIHPMEGWDATGAGLPSDLTRRRWRNFGRSGAGWIWGGEAVAVQPSGRANPNQLLLNEKTAPHIGELREELLDGVREHGGDPDSLVVGLQLTHSGRWSRPVGEHAPRIAYRHPILDRRVGVSGDDAVLSDEEIDELVRDFAGAAACAAEQGFHFVDIKHCHGYLLHEFLSARRRAGRFGGDSLADRSRLLEEIVAAVRAAAPELAIAVRLSVFDSVPYHPGDRLDDGSPGTGVPERYEPPYRDGFGVSPEQPTEPDLTEPIALVQRLRDLGVSLLNVTAGSPYYVPHLQRPALFPPSDGYLPPEDPLVGVARLLDAARRIKKAVPEMIVVSTGWTYLQEYLPHVAQACLRAGWFDAIGLGRMVLTYPELPADVLAGRPLSRKRICRTFSDCTTAPRNGQPSGCYPLDPFYRDRPERLQLDQVKGRRRG